jgi:hypothetical protein
MPGTLRKRLLFITKQSPEAVAFERGKSGKEPKPDQRLDDRSLVKWETSHPENPQGQTVLGVARELVRTAQHVARTACAPSSTPTSSNRPGRTLTVPFFGRTPEEALTTPPISFTIAA